MMLLDRRGFVATLAAGVSSIALRRKRGGETHAGVQILVVTVGDGTADAEVFRGLEMGIDEARRAAAMFGGSIETRRVARLDGISSAPGMIQIVIEDAESVPSPRALRAVRDAGAVLVSVASADEALRAACHRHVLYVAPSPRAIQAAKGSASDSAAGDVTGWHSSLTRFGADTLNKRYHSRYSTPMTEKAWYGWFAVKAMWEAALQSKASSAADVLAWIERPATRFDGHKGSPLYFDWRHELVQPLYVVRDNAVVAEFTPPARAVVVSETPLRCEWKE